MNSYWNHNGTYQKAADELHKLVPASGECSEATTKNKHLDRFRRASNCYYDLFNNGLCNRAQEFRRLFGFSPDRYNNRRIAFSDYLYSQTEPVMDKFVLHAAAEQGIKVV